MVKAIPAIDSCVINYAIRRFGIEHDFILFFRFAEIDQDFH